ncbi:hypothetical protein PFICI_13357 [Pestalotiopsis fici W106-1]|uniref:Uncharacterized protein n=1 Tax=Pestalotiopsis fici (strain W106-1 / CGMCC3.15140) TaxID=1229662 RepID=W3WLY0_PESFW|nr:uncharacterized protein PFICI_13357 [Pestalotiopsis fici W106-1]ETS74873.1 hypothetical protein PFICI_13357 [Pestalotiopsis fici W106-1]
MDRMTIVNAVVDFINAKHSLSAAFLVFGRNPFASMSSPSPSLRRGAEPPSPLELRTGRSFKRRFDPDVTDDQDRGKSPKRRTLKNYVSFNPFESQHQRPNVSIPGKRLFVDRQAQKQPQHPPPRPSTPEPPLMLAIEDSYRKYQTAKFSEVLTKIDATSEHITEEALSQTHAGQLAMEKFSSKHASILESVLEVKTTLSVSSPNGTRREKDVLISDMIADAERRANTTAKELEQLWADTTVAPPVGDLDSEHAAAMAELEEELDKMGENTIGEYDKYEKVRF